ncbi:uncharacterized protein LOC106636470 isoform X2 [Copidosoma floridanum]|uniref:uncharacterized protein LOC106636470 isoform X2 n=1 Tax=Copidosoma floridanum TaxID=29053 RepID=UPI000C6F569A|nr:uncharacterized protein LOC106636470 isoform X2 [Copidosoma floridanum]
MKWFERARVRSVIFLLLAVCPVLPAKCQDNVEHNGTKIIGLKDPNVDATVKSALENGTVSEVVVRKDLLLFPVNAPNLVIAHRQEIHAVPQNNSTEGTNGKPTAAEVAEVNEYSLSQVVSNDTSGNDESVSTFADPAAARGPQNGALLEPGKLLEIPSGFNISDGLATEKVALPDEVQNVSVPKKSIVDLLSKSLGQSDASLTTVSSSSIHKLLKRSVAHMDSNNTSTTTTTIGSLVDYSAMVKRSADLQEDGDATTENTKDFTTFVEKRSIDYSDEDDSDSDESSSSSSSAAEIGKTSVDSTTDSASSTTPSNGDGSSTSNIVKRSVEMDGDGNDDDNDGDDNSVSTSEPYDPEVDKSSSTTNSSNDQNQTFIGGDSEDQNGKDHERQYVPENEVDEDMDVAEDIVFRPLFRYRQETRLRHQYSPDRRNYYENRYRYKTGDSDYD